jgi:hypothetical protein
MLLQEVKKRGLERVWPPFFGTIWWLEDILTSLLCPTSALLADGREAKIRKTLAPKLSS